MVDGVKGYNLSDPEKATIVSNLIINHYNSVRSNILEFVRIRDRYAYFTIISIAAIFSLALSNKQNHFFLFLIPFICLISAFLYMQVEMSIGALCSWLKNEYSKELTKLTGNEISHWDASEEGATFFSEKILAKRSIIIGFIYFLSCSIAGYLLLEKYGIKDNYILGIVYLGFSVASVFIASQLATNRRAQIMKFHKSDL